MQNLHEILCSTDARLLWIIDSMSHGMSCDHAGECHHMLIMWQCGTIIVTCSEREAVLSIPDLFLDLLKFLQACILPLYQFKILNIT